MSTSFQRSRRMVADGYTTGRDEKRRAKRKTRRLVQKALAHGDYEGARAVRHMLNANNIA